MYEAMILITVLLSLPVVRLGVLVLIIPDRHILVRDIYTIIGTTITIIIMLTLFKLYEV